MTNEYTTEDMKQAAKELGRKGGLKTSEKHGPEHYRRIQALGVKTKLARKKANS